MKKITSILIAGALITSLTGCAQPGQPGGITNAQGGTVIGAVLGGLAGTQIGHGQGTTVAIIGGTLLGGFLGNRLGNALDQQSQIAADQAEQLALERNRAESWQTSQASGVIRPHRTYVKHHRVCRSFTTIVSMESNQQVVHGVACKDNNGIWKIQR